MPEWEPNPTEAIVVARLIDARRRAKLSQRAAARFVGVHRPSISLLEAGRQRLTVKLAFKLCEVYGVSASDIFRSGTSTACRMEDQKRDEAREVLKNEAGWDVYLKALGTK